MGLSQPATSIEQAIMLMGLDRLFSLVQGVCIRNSLDGVKLEESFWKTAADVAGISGALAAKYTGIDRNIAYTAGMLHNVGIAIMCKHNKGFQAFIKEHEQLDTDELCLRERDKFDTDHFLQGALMAKDWHLSADIPLAIRYQPLAEKIFSGRKKNERNRYITTCCYYLSEVHQ